MAIKQINIAPISAKGNDQAARLSVLTLLMSSAVLFATSATAATSMPDATARYQAERAVCLNGQSNQDRATCLKEAGAALQEARAGHLNDDPNNFSRNAVKRCEKLPADEQDACKRRIAGEGTVSGDVLKGGIVRELVVPVPVTQ